MDIRTTTAYSITVIADTTSQKPDIEMGTGAGWKVEGNKVWVPTPGRLRPALGQRLGWVLGAKGGRPLRCEGPGVPPQKSCENSDAKSCILVTTCCEISCFLKTTAKKLGTNTLLVPQSLYTGAP